MAFKKWFSYLAPTLVVAGLLVLGFFSFDVWREWLLPPKVAANGHEAEEEHAHGATERVKLTPQARANLQLVLKPAELQTYWRTIQIPGTVVERPDESDRVVSAPVAGIVTNIAVVPGTVVQPQDELFTVRLLSENLQSVQSQLYKAVLDLRINEDEQKRLRGEGTVGEQLFRGKLIDLGYEQRRLQAAIEAYTQDLSSRDLTGAEIDQIKKGTFLTEMKITPQRRSRPKSPGINADGIAVAATGNDVPSTQPLYEVEEVLVKLGEQVQAGQALLQLASHQNLYVEGRGFETDTPLLERATEQGWPLAAEFVEEATALWPRYEAPLRISFLGNKIDVANRTFPFYVPISNQHRERAGPTGKPMRLWRFRPGQRVLLQVPVQQFQDQFVLPQAALVREGPEAYVFRANGDALDRKPVHVLFEDNRNVVIANDGSIAPGNLIAQNGAAQLNRVLKAAAGGGGHGHDHAGHDH